MGVVVEEIGEVAVPVDWGTVGTGGLETSWSTWNRSPNLAT